MRNIFDLSSHPDTRELKTPLAIQYAELGLIEIELGVCLEMIARWQQRIDRGDTKLAAILIRDTALVIAEIFGKGGISVSEVFGADEDARNYLKWFCDIRDTYSAHRFGSSRYSQTVLHLANEGEAAQVLGVSYFVSVSTFDIPGFKEGVEEFLETALAYVRPRLEVLNSQVLAEARAMPAADLNALPKASYKTTTLNEVARTRNEVRSGAPAQSRRREQKSRRGPPKTGG